jgi:hypothetical protein
MMQAFQDRMDLLRKDLLEEGLDDKTGLVGHGFSFQRTGRPRTRLVLSILAKV